MLELVQNLCGTKNIIYKVAVKEIVKRESENIWMIYDSVYYVRLHIDLIAAH